MSSQAYGNTKHTKFGTYDPAELMAAAVEARQQEVAREWESIAEAEREIERSKARIEIASADVENLQATLAALWSEGFRL